MKHFKRAAAMLLAVVLSLCLAVTAFAEDTVQSTGNLTVTGSGLYIPGEGGAAGAGKYVTAIRMFTARVTGDATADPAQQNDFDSYVLEEAWKGFFTDESRFSDVKTAGGITDPDMTPEKITKEALSDAAVAYVKSLTNDTTTNAGTLAAFAHDAQKWARVQANNQTLTDATLINTAQANTAKDSSDVTKGTATFKNLTAGYYLVFPEGGSTGNGNRGTDAILVNVPKNGGVTEQTIKSTFPTVVKQVSNNGNDYQDNTTAQVGETVTFKLTAKVPDMTDYGTYKFVFHDTLSNGLAYDEGSVTVTIGGTVVTEDTDYTVNEPTEESKELTVTFDDLTEVTGVVAGQEIVVTYTAKITKDAVTTNPATNKVYLEYSNDPSSGGTGTSNPDESKVYTYEIKIHKFYKDNETDKPLAGATFTLTTSETDSANGIDLIKDDAAEGTTGLVYHVKGYDETGTSTKVVTTDATGVIIIKGLKAGTYYLHETVAPTGYNKLKKPVKIEITLKDGDYTKPVYNVTVNGETTTGEVNDSTINVENVKGVMLPETGSIGTIGLTVAGVAIVLLGVFAPRKKKKSNQE